MMTEQAGPKDLVSHVVGAEDGRVRLRRQQRPLLPVARRDGALAARVGGARRRRAGHQPHPADDLRDLPDASGTTRRSSPRRPRPCRSSPTAGSPSGLGAGREPQRARRRAAAGRRPTSGRRCSSRRIQIIRDLFDGDGYTNFRGEHFDVESAKLWDLPEKRVPIGVAVSGKQSCEIAGELADVMIGVEPKAGARRVLRRRRRRAASRGSARCRSASAPTRPRPSPGRTRCSAGSASAGRSTPSCPARRPSTRPASSSARRTSRQSIPCGDDVDAVLEAAKEYADAGFTHLALVQIGGDQQEPFLEWSEKTLMPAWRDAFGD